MAADIMALSNTLVYNGRMLCGNDSVANAKLHLPGLADLALCGSARAASLPQTTWPRDLTVPGWLMAVLRPECRVVFLDTDSVAGCREVVLQDGMVNRGEARLVYSVVSALAAAGLSPGEIGVASPYKAQVAALQQVLAALPLSPERRNGIGGVAGSAVAASELGTDGGKGNAVEVLTVDKYQGRDKATILLSFVRCNASRSAGRLLADWQRLNVAITRARTKLVLVGSAATLTSIPMLDDLLAVLRRRDWVQRLSIDCLAELPAMPAAAAAAAPGLAPR
jgi:DNA replication ATP-dependent helicase Dna2